MFLLASIQAASLLISLSPFLFSPQPDELEGVHTHTFKLKPFKKAKSCDICKQAITKEGLICKGECLPGRLRSERVICFREGRFIHERAHKVHFIHTCFRFDPHKSTRAEIRESRFSIFKISVSFL